jgi:hypothetical protein
MSLVGFEGAKKEQSDSRAPDFVSLGMVLAPIWQ